MEQIDFERIAERTVLRSDAVESVRLAHFALEMKADILSVVMGGYSYGLTQIAEKFDRNEIPYTQVVSAGKAAMSAIDVLAPYLEENHLFLGTFVVCSLAESHSVGKDMCAMLLKCSGFKVVDLGEGVAVADILSAIRSSNAVFVATSAPVTEALPLQKELEEAMVREGLKGACLTCVGGSACSQQWADSIGADIFSSTFSELLKKALDRVQKP